MSPRLPYPPPVAPPISRVPQTTHELLDVVANEHPDFDAYVEPDGTRMSFSQWNSRALSVAGYLHERGVKKGDVVTLLLPSSIDYAVSYLAAMNLGAITSGINPRLGPTEISSILRRTDSAILITDDERTFDHPQIPRLSRNSLHEVFSSHDFAGEKELDQHSEVAIVWTSGTTGEPKGAVFDHSNLAAVSVGAGPLRAPFDRRISPSPFSHVGYMTHVYEEIAYVISVIVPPTPWTPEEVLHLLERERVSVGQGVPSQWRLLLDSPSFDKADLSAMRIAGAGAAPSPPAMVREIRRRLGIPFVIGYTSTEAALTTGSLPDDSPEVIAATVGRARENVELRIVDDQEKPVSINTVGNIQCRSDAMMRRYWRDPQRTQEVINSEGWLRTGDSGSLDENGYLTLAGRRSEMYLRGGYNVYPVEVERVLCDYPGVRQAAVVGTPDSVLGEIGVAFLVTDPDVVPTREELAFFVKGHIADYKAPDAVVVVDALPLTSMGKVDKRSLYEKAAALTTTRKR